jgi:uncharacterized protein YndB with AHSA1/START domain
MNKTTITAEPGRHDIIMTREFDAPRDLVFKVCNDPKHIPNWWGPRRLTTTVDKLEVKSGGQWRFIQHDEQGNEFAFHGVYHAIIAPERTVMTFEFEGFPGHVSMETSRFESLLDNRTRITTVSVFQSVEDRDGMVATGMEEGAIESWDRVEEILQTL